MVVWKSKAVQNELRRAHNGPWLWDGNKIAWYVFISTFQTSMLTARRSSCDIPELRIHVNLDAEKGRPPRQTPDMCYCIIKQTKKIRMEAINAYLKKQMAFDNSVLEGISKFLTSCEFMCSLHC